MSHFSRRFLTALSIAALLITGIGSAASAQSNNDVSLSPSGLLFNSASFGNGYTLRVSAPDGAIHEFAFAAGEAPGFALNAIDAPEGAYQWELRPVIAPRDRARDAAPVSTDKNILSGSFRVAGGAIVVGGEEASDVSAKAAPLTKAQVVTQDQIVQGSQCVGLDCSSSENFGFDTIRLKENNLRIKFEDTSASASFPGNDWQLTANDSDNGGANKFSIDDVTNNKTPFTVLANAPNNSLFVDASGKVGFGTATPVVNLHLVEGNSPTLRLEQDGSDGFASQTWDIAGNETNFFIRDVNNSSNLPFRIKPGAPENAFFIAADGTIGMGTDSPAADLHIKDNKGTTELFLEETNDTTLPRSLLRISNKGNTRVELIDTSVTTGQTWFVSNNNGSMNLSAVGTNGAEFQLGADGRLEVGPGGAANFTLQANGNATLTGTLTQLSDRNAKTDFEALDSKTILAKVADLEVLGWRYKDDGEEVRHIGPMAQDFYAAFGLNGTDTGITSVDTAGVAFAAIQGLNAELEAKSERVEALESQNTELVNRLTALEAIVEAIAASAE